MNNKQIIALVLIVVGCLALAYPEFTYVENRKVVDMGPVSTTFEDRESIRIPSALGGIAIGAGAVLFYVAWRRE